MELELLQAPKTCTDVQDVMAGDHSCGSRINWLVNHAGKSQTDAENQVAGEFPQEC